MREVSWSNEEQDDPTMTGIIENIEKEKEVSVTTEEWMRDGEITHLIFKVWKMESFYIIKRSCHASIWQPVNINLWQFGGKSQTCDQH